MQEMVFRGVLKDGKSGRKRCFQALQKQASTHESNRQIHEDPSSEPTLNGLAGWFGETKEASGRWEQPFHPCTLLVLFFLTWFFGPRISGLTSELQAVGLSEPNDKVRGLVEHLLTKSSVVA